MAYARTRSSKTDYAATGDLHSRLTQDTPTPLYKARVAAGELFSKDFLSSNVDVAGPKDPVVGFNVLLRPKINLGLVKMSTARAICTPSNWEYMNTGAMVSQVLTKCNMSPLYDPSSYEWAVKQTSLSADLNSGISSVLVSAAELPKTIKMINRAVTLLRHPFVDARKELRVTRTQMRTPAGRKAILNRAESNWLEGRYGWRPFIYDVMSWVEAGKSKYSERRTVKDALGARKGSFTEYLNATSTGIPPLTRKREWTVDWVASCGQTADFGINLSQFARTWGALDVVGTAWDLVKLSFVIDWFLNLGDTLKALQVFALVDERIGWNKVQSVAQCKTSWTYPDLGTYGDREVNYLLNLPQPPTIERIKLTKRIAVTSFLPILGASFNVDCAKTLDLLAILHQVVRGGESRSR